MDIKRTVVAATTAALLTFSLTAVTGCGASSDEDLIRDAITSELESIKTLDEAFLAEMVDGLSADEFTTYGIDPTEFMSSYLAGFDYSIGDISVDGDTATATVTLTCKSFSAYEESLTAKSSDAVQNNDLASMSEDEINKLIGKIMVEALNEVEPATTEPITLEYTKEGNVWTPTAASEEALTNAMLSN